MPDDELGWHDRQLKVLLPAWLIVIGGTALSVAFTGLMADVGLVLALVGFVVLLVQLQRAPKDS